MPTIDFSRSECLRPKPGFSPARSERHVYEHVGHFRAANGATATSSSAERTVTTSESPIICVRQGHGDFRRGPVTIRADDMATIQNVLAAISIKELLPFVTTWGLHVGDRRVKQQVVDALAKSPKTQLAAILQTLSRDRLKQLCRALTLDDGGRKKVDLIDRILVHTRVKHHADKARAREIADAVARGESNAQEPLSRTRLEQHLWAAADILRGQIDAADYKNYILGLLFLKRLSDVFFEETDKLIARGLPHELAWSSPDEHQFFVPEYARWSTIEKAHTNIGRVLNRACEVLEEQNASLRGVLVGIDFNDARRLGDRKHRDAILLQLIQHFSQLSLKNVDFSEPDMLGRAYEYLIERFADDAGKKGGEFYTPRGVAQLIVELLSIQENMRVCDPTCGSGSMLIECAQSVARRGGDGGSLTLHGQEKNVGTWAICKMNMLLHGFVDARIEAGDTIRDPRLLRDGALMRYDRVIANPPFSLDAWGMEVASHDAFGRFRFGVPPKTKGDLAFVQHMVATLNPRGRLGVVMPHGVLFRGSTEGEIRRGLLELDLFEAVIGLARNLFYGTSIAAAIWVLNRDKAPQRRGKILFIDASREFESGSAQNYLRDAHIEKIVGAFRDYGNVERFARVASLQEVEENDFNLNISRFVDTSEKEERLDITQALAELRQLIKIRNAAEAKMLKLLAELGYDDE